ncbi:hypothetical protein ACF0H5_001345 [Mactra antiquata]
MPVIERYDSMKMLSSSASQYLPPDYLQPLPTTLDAKNSPLALLAQTCSSIGKDPPSKSIIPPLEKKDTSGKSPHSDSDHDNKATPIKKEDCRSSSSSSEQRRGESKDITHFYPISTSSPKPEKIQSDNKRIKDERQSHDGERKSPINTSKSQTIQSSGLNGTKSNIDRASPRPRTSDIIKDNRDSKYSPSPKSRRSESPIRREHSPGQETKHPHSLYPGLPYGPFGLPYPGALPPTAETFPAGYPYPGFPSQSNYSLASAHALAAHQAALKSGSSAALSQYMQYARMRNPAAGSSACKDPYCTNCLSAAAAQSSHLSQCTSPGCAQCSHEKTLQGMSLFGLPGSNPLQSPFNVPSSASVGLTHLHNLYAQSLLTQQGQQHVCNWMMGNDYCGKRFSSSEELLQHLRTHTSGGEAALSAYSNLGLSIPAPTDLPAGLPGYLGSSGSISPGTLRRMYPTSISPLSGSSLSNRYHPYKPSLPNLPSGLPTHQSLSSLGPYYSPYSLYAQRIGAAAVP